MQTLPCLVRMCSKEHLLEERVEGAETLAYLMEPDVELQRIASTTDHLVAMLADYFKYPSSVSAITDIKRVGLCGRFTSFFSHMYVKKQMFGSFLPTLPCPRPWSTSMQTVPCCVAHV